VIKLSGGRLRIPTECEMGECWGDLTKVTEDL
jgi:hypothetical protein